MRTVRCQNLLKLLTTDTMSSCRYSLSTFQVYIRYTSGIAVHVKIVFNFAVLCEYSVLE